MNNEPGTITLVPTGPLTNIAMAVRMEPRIVERVKEVVLMGGGYHVGNWSAVAEFNIKVDPEAAHIVFNEAWPITMVGLDLTHQALCTPAVQRRIEGVGTDLAMFVSGLMDFFRKTYQDNQDFIDPPVHDPCTVAYLIDPSVVQTRRCPVDIEIHGELTPRHDRRRPARPRAQRRGMPHPGRHEARLRQVLGFGDRSHQSHRLNKRERSKENNHD